jgi:hypothetical protein
VIVRKGSSLRIFYKKLSAAIPAQERAVNENPCTNWRYSQDLLRVLDLVVEEILASDSEKKSSMFEGTSLDHLQEFLVAAKLEQQKARMVHSRAKNF